ncbi:MAG: class E sortase [Armatimonadota bacterium]
MARERRCPRALPIVLMLGGSILVFATVPTLQFIDSQIARRHRLDADARLRQYDHQLGASVTLSRAQKTVVAPGTDGYLLDIPRIGLRAVVRELEPEVFSGRNTPALKRYGLGQVPYTVGLRNVSPGGEGTAAITGHRTTSGAPFRYLDRLRPGDVIVIRKGGVEQRWAVVGSATVGPRAVDAIRSRSGSRRLALLACDPPFSASERLIVYAELKREGLYGKGSANRMEPAARASHAIITGGAQHMRSLGTRMLGLMAILNMFALSVAVAVAVAHPTPSPPSPGGPAPNPAPGPDKPLEGPEPQPAPAPPPEKPAAPPEVLPPPPPAPAPALPPAPPPVVAEPQPAPPPEPQPAPAPVAVPPPAPAPITRPRQPLLGPGIAPAQPAAPPAAQPPSAVAVPRPAVVVVSSAPAAPVGKPAVAAQAAPMQLPFGGISPGLALFVSVMRWVGAALVIAGIIMYTSHCARRGSSDGRAEA